MKKSIQPSKRYPDVLFNAITFINENKKILENHDRSEILSIDLSDDISVTSRCVQLILHNLDRMGIDKIALNLSGTSVDSNLFSLIRDNKSIKQINISDTEAAQDDYLYEEGNILEFSRSMIFIFLSEEEIYDLVGLNKSIIQDHIDYYSNI